MPEERSPVIAAPEGFMWAWRKPETAHLIPERGSEITRCGRRFHADNKAFAVGGYSAQPCASCLETI